MSNSQRFAFRGLGAALSNLLLATLFFSFAYAHLQRFLVQPRLSLLLIVAVEGLVAVMLVIRRDPENTQHGWKTWVATSIGTFAPMLLRPIDAPTDLLVGQVLQVAAFGLQIGAVLSLNRSFGLLPAHRGVKSDGLYRWVRHPLYSAYLLAHVGYLASNLSWANVPGGRHRDRLPGRANPSGGAAAPPVPGLRALQRHHALAPRPGDLVGVSNAAPLDRKRLAPTHTNSRRARFITHLRA